MRVRFSAPILPELPRQLFPNGLHLLTQLASLAYVGHSLGTDMMFALQSLMPEIGQLVRPFIALAPIAYLGHIWSSARLGVPLEPFLKLGDPTNLNLISVK